MTESGHFTNEEMQVLGEVLGVSLIYIMKMDTYGLSTLKEW